MKHKCISSKEEVDLYNFMKDFQDPDPECCFKSFDKITGNALSITNENVCSKCNAVMDENTFANGPAVREAHKKTNAMLFAYFSNGLPQVLGGEGNNFDDVYFIYYAPITTKSGEAKGIDKNGYHLSAYKDADKNGSLNIFIGIKIIDGTLVLLPGSDEQIPELSFTSS